MIIQSNIVIQEQEKIRTIYFTTLSFTYIYDRQVNEKPDDRKHTCNFKL